METFLINLFSVFILALFSLGPSIIGSMLIWALQGFTVKSEETAKKIIVSWRGEHWYFWML